MNSPYRTIKLSLPGPVPTYPTRTPTSFSMNSTYSFARCGRSSHLLMPVVLVCHPGRVVYSIRIVGSVLPESGPSEVAAEARRERSAGKESIADDAAAADDGGDDDEDEEW